MSKPMAVLVADVHYSVHTLDLADKAIRQAIDKANELGVTLVVAGDLHDTKANLRGECVEAMIETFKTCIFTPVVIVGNHDKINEKSDKHSLKFLENYVYLIEKPTEILLGSKWYAIPYYHDAEELRTYLKTIPRESRIIMHQGIIGSEAGHYIQDKSAITKEDVEDFRVISGHYHKRQDIKCGRPRKDSVGLFSYLGNPYTLGFGEANDPPKGFQLLMNDGTLEFVPTNLRNHCVMDITINQLRGECVFLGETQDLVWVKIRGRQEELSKLSKDYIAQELDITQSFKLDLIPTEVETSKDIEASETSQPQMFDDLIDSLTNTVNNQKERLKSLWKDFVP